MAFDNGRALIRADAGSLLSVSLRLLCALLCQDLRKMRSSHVPLFAYLELNVVDQLDEALPDPLQLVWARGEPSAFLRRSF